VVNAAAQKAAEAKAAAKEKVMEEKKKKAAKEEMEAAMEKKKKKKAAKEKADHSKVNNNKKKEYQELKSRVMKLQMPEDEEEKKTAMNELDNNAIGNSINYNCAVRVLERTHCVRGINKQLGNKTPSYFYIEDLDKGKQEDEQQEASKKKKNKNNDNKDNNKTKKKRGSGSDDDDDETSVLRRTWNMLKGSISRSLNIRFRSVTSQLNSGQVFDRLRVLLTGEEATKNEVR
jgi:hypothetical protein